MKDAGKELNALRSWRNRADYDMNRPLPQAMAAGQVQAAEWIIQILDAIVEPTRTQITDAMKVYERDVLKDVTWQQP